MWKKPLLRINYKGITLLETLISLAVFSISFVGIISLIGFAKKNIKHGMNKEFVTLEAKNLLENVSFYIISTTEFPNIIDDIMYKIYPNNCVKDNAITFKNLSNDTILVIQYSQNNPSSYVNILKFIQFNEQDKIIKLWEKVGKLILKEMSNQNTITFNKKLFKNNKLYLSTRCHSVPWLHIKISTKPTYFKSIYTKQL